MPFIFLLLATLEIAMMFATASLLEGGTSMTARLIRTGQIQQSGAADPEAMFRERLCDLAQTMVVCDEVQIEVMPMASFFDFDTMGAQFDEDGNMVSRGFDAGGSDDAILIRVAYRYTMMTPLIGALLAGPDDSTLFMSTIVLQTEPYDFGEAAGV
jgi:hypothetical protein